MEAPAIYEEYLLWAIRCSRPRKAMISKTKLLTALGCGGGEGFRRSKLNCRRVVSFSYFAPLLESVGLGPTICSTSLACLSWETLWRATSAVHGHALRICIYVENPPNIPN